MLHIENYKKFIRQNLSTKPKSSEDAKRFSQLHSWYKHLPRTGKTFFAFLQRGEQMRYDFDRRFERDQYTFHWHFVACDIVDQYPFKPDDYHMLTGFPVELRAFFAKYPITLDNRFGSASDDVHRYDIIERVTDEIWEALVRCQQANIQPPKLLVRKYDENRWGIKLCNYVKSKHPSIYNSRNTEALLELLSFQSKSYKSEISDIHERVSIVLICRRSVANYCDLGIIEPGAVDIFDDALATNKLDAFDILEAFGYPGLVSDGAREMMKKIIGDRANEFVYLSDVDFSE